MRKIFLAIVSTLCLLSCKEEPMVVLSVSELAFTSDGGETAISLTSNFPWSASTDVDWVSLSSKQGKSGSSEIIISVSPNTSLEGREIAIIFRCQITTALLKISQKESIPYIYLDKNEFNVSHKDSEIRVTVFSNIEWVAEVNDWCNVSPNLGKEGETEVIINIQENNSVEKRAGVISFKSIDDTETWLTISQDNIPVALLPDGSTFGNIISRYNEVEHIKFIVNSYKKGINLCDDIEIIFNDKTLEFHTPCSIFALNKISNQMFSNMSWLKSIDLSNCNTQKVIDMNRMFHRCFGLTHINVSSFDTKNVRNMSGMFFCCQRLTSLDVSNFNTENVTDMSFMFAECHSLASLDLSSFNTQKVTYMHGMFYFCIRLTSLELSNFNTYSVTDMSRMFAWCPLSSLDLSSFNTSNVVNMNEMFHNCSNLKYLNISSFNIKNVTDMRYMFFGCSSFTSLDISSFAFTNNPVVQYIFSSVGKNAFSKPIPIYVFTSGKAYLESKSDTGINPSYAQYVVKDN